MRYGVWLHNKPKDLSQFVSEERGHGRCTCVCGKGEGVGSHLLTDTSRNTNVNFVNIFLHCAKQTQLSDTSVFPRESTTLEWD